MKNRNFLSIFSIGTYLFILPDDRQTESIEVIKYLSIPTYVLAREFFNDSLLRQYILVRVQGYIPKPTRLLSSFSAIDK